MHAPGTRVGVIAYSTDTFTALRLNDTYDLDEIDAALRAPQIRCQDTFECERDKAADGSDPIDTIVYAGKKAKSVVSAFSPGSRPVVLSFLPALVLNVGAT